MLPRIEGWIIGPWNRGRPRRDVTPNHRAHPPPRHAAPSRRGTAPALGVRRLLRPGPPGPDARRGAPARRFGPPPVGDVRRRLLDHRRPADVVLGEEPPRRARAA